jgi:hypothetical protein
MSMSRSFALVLVAALGLGACGRGGSETAAAPAAAAPRSALEQHVDRQLGTYATVRLTTDTRVLDARERRMLALFIRAAQIVDELFWLQAAGAHSALRQSVRDPLTRRFIEMNYGPWDRLDGNRPFVAGVGAKPAGAAFYPADMTDAEFQALADPARTSLYTLLRRDAAGKLTVLPYREAYGDRLRDAATLLREAAALAPQASLRHYLELRATALETDDYRASDFAWLAMKDNRLDLVIGPIEVYEDQRYNLKAAYEAYVLVKDHAWSERLARNARLLPELQRGLPVPPAYKRESPGTDSDLNAYDVVYYAGDANAGAKTIAINLPNDEEVQLQSGTRRLQLKNAMRAKFERILVPIADTLIDPAQRRHIRFDAFFANVMFHEVAHGLGIKRTVDGRAFVREALAETSSALEEAKADVLGLHLVTQLLARGELTDTELMDHYVTFVAGIVRSVRFGASAAHGRANMIEFNALLAERAIDRDAAGHYRVDAGRMTAAIEKLARRILVVQGDGDVAAARAMLADEARVPAVLEGDLARLVAARIPVDVVFEQGPAVLALDAAATGASGQEP